MPREPKFLGTITYTTKDIAGVTAYTGKKDERTLEEVLDITNKSEVLDARKDLMVAQLEEKKAKIQKQGDPNPKRYTVDPETGKIDVDEEGGEYTQKDAMMVAASIKGKSGQYDAAISLITAAKALTADSQPKAAEKPKEWYVDPETGIIVHDPENGEYTLSEARTVSQSMKSQPEQAQAPQGYYIDTQGEKHLLNPGEPIVIKHEAPVAAQPGKSYFFNPETQQLEEIEAGKPIVITLKQGGDGAGQMPFPVLGNDNKPVYDKDGNPVIANLEPLMKWLGFQADQRRANEKHNAGISLFTTIKENFADGVSALKAAAEEAKGTGTKTPAAEPQQQVFSCGTCGVKFSTPPGWEGQSLECPKLEGGCGRIYTKEELLA